MTKPRTSRVGPYEILALIGVGGMGEVYRARDSRLRREVAIKFLPEDFTANADRRARFEREARVLASLNHPNIAAIYGLEESEDGMRGLVLELVEGPTLAELAARGPLPTSESLSIAKQIAAALAAAHEAGIVHRDLKPQNIKVRADGSVKVLDFGLAKTIARDPHGSPDGTPPPTVTAGNTTPGAVLGTPAYMSPEQTRGREVDKRTDVWAFGCVLYEMLTGRRAFDGDDVPDTIAAVLRGEPNWSHLPPDLPPGAQMLLRRCLEKDASRRLRDLGDVGLLIEDSAVLSQPPAAAREPRVRARVARRGGPIIAIFAVVAFMAVAITAVVFRPERSPASSAGASTLTQPQAAPAAAAPVPARAERLPNSIAVLPLENLSEDRGDAYWAIGLHAEILNQLGKLRNLTVISQSSVKAYAENRPALAKIAEELGVSSIMEGTVRYAGNQLSVNAQLTDPETGRLLWSGSFRADRGNVDQLLDIQTDIATAIASALGTEITAEDRRRIDRVPTDSTVAYASFLRAQDFSTRGLFADTIRELDAAIAQDGRFAEAYAHRAYIYAYAQVTSASRALLSRDERFRNADFQALARDDADRALELYDGAELAWLARAVTDMFRLRYRDAEAAFQRALDLNPNDPSVLSEYAQFRLNRGDAVQEVLPFTERALRFNPNGPLTLTNAAGVFRTAGRIEDATAALDKALLVEPENLTVQVTAALAGGDAATREQYARNSERLSADQGVWGLIPAAIVYRQLGKEREATAALDRYAELGGAQRIGDADWALYYRVRGDIDAAYESLERAVAKLERGEVEPGYLPLQLLLVNSRGAQATELAQPRFQRLFERVDALADR